MKSAVFACLILLLMPVAAIADDTISVKAIVVDSEGEPVSGVTVSAVELVFDTQLRKLNGNIVDSQVSDGDGTVTFQSLLLTRSKESRGYHFIAYMPGKHIGWSVGKGRLSTAYWSPEPDVYRIVVTVPGIHEGRVVDEQDQGIQGVTVEPINVTFEEAIHLAALEPVMDLKAVTDSEGKYLLKGIPEGGSFSAWATKSGYATARYIEDDPIVMEPGGSISGRVLDDSGNTIDAVVTVSARGAGASRSRASNGSFAIYGLPAGEYFVNVQSENHLDGLSSAQVTAGENAVLPDIILNEGVPVTGKAVHKESGVPLRGVRVVVAGPDRESPTWRSSVNTESDGTFRLRGLPGNAVITCDLRDFREITIPESGHAHLVLESNRFDVVTGRVVDQDGNAVEHAIVILQGDVYNPGANGAKLTGSDGRFEAVISSRRDSPGG